MSTHDPIFLGVSAIPIFANTLHKNGSAYIPPIFPFTGYSDLPF